MSFLKDLKAELDANHSAKSNAQAAADINAKNIPATKRVLKSDLIVYLGSIGKITAIIQDSKSNKANKDAAETILWLLNNPHGDDIDVNAGEFQAGLVTMVSELTLSQAQSDVITAMGNMLQSIADQKGWGIVHETDCMNARLNY